jgi:hypothetical protein
MTQKARYEYIEDNGGGLHLFIFDKKGNVVAGITNLEHAEAGEYKSVVRSLKRDPLAEVRRWEGHMAEQGIDPAKFYGEILQHKFGYDTVADSNGTYPQAMGAAAQRYFGID